MTYILDNLGQVPIDGQELVIIREALGTCAFPYGHDPFLLRHPPPQVSQ